MVSKTVAVRSIYLDPKNPRHDPIDNESEIIAHLLKTEDVRALARSISELGSLNPLDLLALFPHPKAKNKFITAEGNRRVCALKLLLDPDKAPTDRDKKYFRALQAKMPKPIKTVEASLFSDQSATRTWVGIRHDGEQGGVGTKAWKPAQSTRFKLQADGSTPNGQALRLLDYARRQQLLSDDDLNEIGITTVTRYLSNPVMRSALGLADNKSLWITVPQAEFEQAVTVFLQDALGENATVNSRTNAKARKAYGESLQARGFAPKTRGLDPHEPTSGQEIPLAEPPSTQPSPGISLATNTRHARNRDNDKNVVPPGFVADVEDAIFQRLFRELRTLNAENFSFAATYLLRAVIEQAAALFLRKHGISTPPPELHRKLERACVILKEQGYSGKGLAALRKMSSDVDSRYSPDTIGLFVHGGAVPNKLVAIRLWDTFEPIMREFVRQLSVPETPGQEG